MKKLLVFGFVVVAVAIFFSLKDHNGVLSSQVQRFDGQKQVVTDKPMGTVVVKGRLY
jgi:hypothetical protein